MAEKSWKVPVVELNKRKIVVNFGGHLVDLVKFQKEININIDGDQVTYSGIKMYYDDNQFDNPRFAVGQLVDDGKVFCNIPYTEPSSSGGRPTKSRRHRPPHRRRRATRRTTRRRRV